MVGVPTRTFSVGVAAARSVKNPRSRGTPRIWAAASPLSREPRRIARNLPLPPMSAAGGGRGGVRACRVGRGGVRASGARRVTRGGRARSRRRGARAGSATGRCTAHGRGGAGAGGAGARPDDLPARPRRRAVGDDHRPRPAARGVDAGLGRAAARRKRGRRGAGRGPRQRTRAAARHRRDARAVTARPWHLARPLQLTRRLDCRRGAGLDRADPFRARPVRGQHGTVDVGRRPPGSGPGRE